jgi:hypothetical protein
MMNDFDEMPGQCEICGETVTQLDVENGEVAEMFDRKDPIGSAVICHTTCGQNKQLELA